MAGCVEEAMVVMLLQLLVEQLLQEGMVVQAQEVLVLEGHLEEVSHLLPGSTYTCHVSSLLLYACTHHNITHPTP